MAWKKCDECNKRLYTSKKSAREGTKTVHNRVRIYPCPHHKGWHATDRKD